MINNYEIVEYLGLGIDVQGESFHFQDLYEMVGQQQFMTTFNFKSGSDAYSRYGESVLGVIYYKFEDNQKLSKFLTNDHVVDFPNIRIVSPDIDCSEEDYRDLKYEGVKVADIESISYLPYRREVEIHNTGEKKVPNIVNIQADFDGIDVDIFRQNYLAKKFNDGQELVQFEKEQLIGTLLVLGEGRIDIRVANALGFDKKSMENNINIWSYRYEMKERRGTITDDEKKKYSENKDIQNSQKIIKLFKELLESGVNVEELNKQGDVLKEINDAVLSFRPSILLHGKKQVYWDVDSYIHLIMRHIKEYQLGNFKTKTPFSYRIEDLKDLLGQVLNRIEGEYITHRATYPKRDFYRVGPMAITFNGDHYNLRIDKTGRLTQFHARGGRAAN